jgi:ElaB/YqjD/DUF883 family membrane-anchored ribosome-binding protein
LVGVFLFVAGIGFQSLFERGFAQVFGGEQGNIWLIIFLYTVSAIVLTIVASVWIGGLSSILNRVTAVADKVINEHRTTRERIQTTQEAIREEVDTSQEAILDAVKSMVGLTAEYIDDRDRAYRRTQDLIENSRERLIFVDWWVDADKYDTGQPRKDYYQAIAARIERHLDQSRGGRGGGFSHVRIVQMDAGTDLGDVSSILSRDEVYWEHIKTCVELQKPNREKPTSVFIGDPFTRTHFAIIDDVFVQPILTTDDEGLSRYGAILYTDRHGELIERYQQLVGDLQKRRLKKNHIR